MPKKASRRLIIDASIARAAGREEAIHPTSKHCCEFLTTVLKVCHRIVITPDILQEWKKHQSRFASTWLSQMYGRKKVHDEVGATVDNKLRNGIKQHTGSEKDCAAMLKDIHLIEAAQATDQTVISLDETVRKLFNLSTKHIGVLKNIVWVNPDKADEQPFLWLKNGAKPEKKRLLGVGMQ